MGVWDINCLRTIRLDGQWGMYTRFCGILLGERGDHMVGLPVRRSP